MPQTWQAIIDLSPSSSWQTVLPSPLKLLSQTRLQTKNIHTGHTDKIIDLNSSAVVEAIVQIAETHPQIPNIIHADLEAAANILVSKFVGGRMYEMKITSYAYSYFQMENIMFKMYQACIKSF
jgi:hypothetical protein